MVVQKVTRHKTSRKTPGKVFQLRCSHCCETRSRKGAFIEEVDGIVRFVCRWCTLRLRGDVA